MGRVFFEKPRTHTHLSWKPRLFYIEIYSSSYFIECVHLFHLLAESKKTVFDSLHAANAAGGYRSRYDAVRHPTIVRLSTIFRRNATASYSFSQGPPVCTGLTSAQRATGEPSSFTNPYCAQNVKRSPSLNKCARCPAHIHPVVPPPFPYRQRGCVSLPALSLSLFFPGVHKTVVETREKEENNKRQALFVPVLSLCSFFLLWWTR